MANVGIDRDEREYMRYLRDVHFKNQNGKCYWCGAHMDNDVSTNSRKPNACTIEHITELSDGGATNVLNTAAVCSKCNYDRSKKYKKIKLANIYTYGYTVGKEDTLVLYNTRETKRNNVLFDISLFERGNVNILFSKKIK